MKRCIIFLVNKAQTTEDGVPELLGPLEFWIVGLVWYTPDLSRDGHETQPKIYDPAGT